MQERRRAGDLLRWVARDTAVFGFAYAKAGRADLTPAQRRAALAFLKELDDGDEA